MSEVRFKSLSEAIKATRPGGVVEERGQYDIVLTSYKEKAWGDYKNGFYVKSEDLESERAIKLRKKFQTMSTTYDKDFFSMTVEEALPYLVRYEKDYEGK